MEKNPEISVLISVRNGLRYIDEAVSSILAQTFSDFEVVVVDDGSDDGTSAWLDEKQMSDARIKVLHREPSNLPSALNAGLAACRGELIARMDADDIALPSRLEKQRAAFLRDPELVLLGTEVELVDEAGRPLGIRGHHADHGSIRRSLLLGNGGSLTHPAVMFRRAAALAAGGYDPLFPGGEDLDFFLKLTDSGKALNLPEVLLHWRQHTASVNRTQFELWQDLKRRAVRATIERIGPHRYSDELFPEASGAPFSTTKRNLVRRALRQQRLGTAADYGREMLLDPEQRMQGAKVLGKVALKWVGSKVRKK